MIVREARCTCGALSAAARGDPARVAACNCRACKRRTGSAFGWSATYAGDQVAVSGAFHSFTRESEDGYRVTTHFCPQCAATIFYEIERRPSMVSIPVGAFADPDFPAPTAEVYGELRSPWLGPLAPDQE